MSSVAYYCPALPLVSSPLHFYFLTFLLFLGLPPFHFSLSLFFILLVSYPFVLSGEELFVAATEVCLVFVSLK